MTDITAETIEEILEISRPEVLTFMDALGRPAPFAHKQMYEVKAAPPALMPVVSVTTLAGFKDLITANLEHEDIQGDWLIHVHDEHTVSLTRRNSDTYGRRPSLIHAQPVEFAKFRFGQWMNQEEFVISVASLFAETEDKAYVLKLASTITREALMVNEDDGFSQKATAKVGLRTKETVTLKPRVALAPYRTFPELDQPVSEFVFRAKNNEGDVPPMLMLVEADGGHWKIDAIAKIKAAMEAFGLGVPIIA